MSSNSVFISYRRDASKDLARAVFQDLKKIRNIDVFMDVENINAGNFGTKILSQIAARPYFLLILMPSTLNRCVETGDWLMREIKHAIKLKRIIIPMTTQGFSFDDVDKFLKPSLAKKFNRFNELKYVHDYFDAVMDKLCRYLEPIDLPITPMPNMVKGVVAQTTQQTINEPHTGTEGLSAQAYCERGLKAYNEHEYDYAITDYTEAIRIDPNDATTYSNRGNARAGKGDNDGAITDYTKAIRIDPNDTTAYSNRGKVYFEIGLYSSALEDFKQASELDSKNKFATAGLAITSHRRGELENATNLWHSLLYGDERFHDADWVGLELNWQSPLIEEARRLITKL